MQHNKINEDQWKRILARAYEHSMMVDDATGKLLDFLEDRGLMAAILHLRQIPKIKYGNRITQGAYGVFFFQHPSMLEYHSGVNKIPSNNQITRLLDDIESQTFAPVFEQGLETAQRYKGLDQYLVLGGRYRLITLDGVWFYPA